MAAQKKQARKSAKKAAKKSARKTTKRKPAQNRRRTPAWRVWLTRILFFPFLLIGKFTREWPWFAKWPARVGLTGAFIGAVCFFLVATFYMSLASRYDMAQVAEMPARSAIYAHDGETELGYLHGDHRYIVNFDNVSPNFRKALIAREDARFYNHGAVDLRSIGRIIFRAITDGKREGASTITMQLARNTYPLGGKNIHRKLLEIAVAHRIENHYQKDEILEHYMNRIFWGHSIRGVEAASRMYFEKPASDLTLSEAAMLAGIIRGPNAFSPFKDIEAAKSERDTVLNRMAHYSFITESDADSAKKEELIVRPEHRRIQNDSYAMDAIRRDLENILERHDIERGGLKVITTIDAQLQQAAEQAVEKRLRAIERLPGYRHQTRSAYRQLPKTSRGTPKYLQGALVCLENHSGAILTIVGGRNADESIYNRALHARRPVGSIFKPFVYLTAFDKGLHHGAWVRDSRIRRGEIKGAPQHWSPKNSDGTYKNFIKVSEALAQSRNTSSVRIGNYAGIANVKETARLVGFRKEIPSYPASYLGAFEATPREVAQAYSVFPNGGAISRPYLIKEITNSKGEIVYQDGVISYPAAKQGSAWSVSNVLQKVTREGTARSVVSKHDFKVPTAGKTGTTKGYRDAWFAGYTSSVTCAVWVGLDKPQQTINRGYGSRLALPIWVDVMKKSVDLGYSADSLDPKFQFKNVRLCRHSSQIATPACEARSSAYNASVPVDSIPKHSCDLHPVRAIPVESPRRSRRQKTPPRAIPVR